MFVFRIYIKQHSFPNIGHLVAVVAMLAILPAAQSGDSALAELEQLFDDEWEFRLREDPLFATRVGDDRYNGRLPSNTLADQQRRMEVRREFLRRLRAIARSALPRGAGVNYDIFERLLRDQVDEAHFQSYLMPITNF